MKWVIDILRIGIRFYWQNRKLTVPATINAVKWVYSKRFWVKKKWNEIFRKKSDRKSN